VAKIVRRLRRLFLVAAPLAVVALLLVLPKQVARATTPFSTPFWTTNFASPDCACSGDCCVAPSRWYSPHPWLRIDVIEGHVGVDLHLFTITGMVVGCNEMMSSVLRLAAHGRWAPRPLGAAGRRSHEREAIE
jgi:hypothetical protein